MKLGLGPPHLQLKIWTLKAHLPNKLEEISIWVSRLPAEPQQVSLQVNKPLKILKATSTSSLHLQLKKPQEALLLRATSTSSLLHRKKL